MEGRCLSKLQRLDKLLEKIVTFILCFHTASVLPLYLIQFAFLGAWRYCVIWIAKKSKPNQLGKPLKLQSAVVANIDDIYKAPVSAIVSPLILEGSPDLGKIRQAVQTQIVNKKDSKSGEPYYPEVKQSVEYWMGYPFWKDIDRSDEDLMEACVTYYQNNEDGSCDWNSLQDIVKELCFKPFTKDKPLIELLIIPHFTSNEENGNGNEDQDLFVVILRLHHCLADGYAIYRFILSLSEDVEFIKPTDYTQALKSTREEGNKITNLASYGFKVLYELTEYFYKSSIYAAPGTLADMKTSPKNGINLPSICRKDKQHDPDLSLMRKNNLVVGFNKELFTLARINEIKKRYDVSGTSVIYCGIIGAVRKFMEEKGHGGNGYIPSKIAFGISLPLPRTNEKLRNHAALMTMFITLDEPDPCQRVLHIDEQISKMKRSTLPMTATLITNCALGLGPRWLSNYVWKKSSNLEFLVISNTAGPKNRFDVMGHRVKEYLWMTGQTIESNKFFINLMSMIGLARVTVMGDVEILDSDEMANQIVQYFFEELRKLEIGGTISMEA